MHQVIHHFRILLHFTIRIGKLNIILSLVFASLVAGTPDIYDQSSTVEINFLNAFIIAFSFIFLTAGFGLSLFFFYLKEASQLYFYYNKGFNEYTLISGACIINILLIIIINLLIYLLL